MILYMIDAQGRARIGQVVSAEIDRQGLTAVELGARGRPGLATIKRIKAGDPHVSDTMLRALGDKLGLPRDFLLYVGSGDVKKIAAAAGADPDLVRWTIDLIRGDEPQNPGRGRARHKGVAG